MPERRSSCIERRQRVGRPQHRAALRHRCDDRPLYPAAERFGCRDAFRSHRERDRSRRARSPIRRSHDEPPAGLRCRPGVSGGNGSHASVRRVRTCTGSDPFRPPHWARPAPRRSCPATAGHRRRPMHAIPSTSAKFRRCLPSDVMGGSGGPRRRGRIPDIRRASSIATPPPTARSRSRRSTPP